MNNKDLDPVSFFELTEREFEKSAIKTSSFSRYKSQFMNALPLLCGTILSTWLIYENEPTLSTITFEGMESAYRVYLEEASNLINNLSTNS